jgi:hypothetical protein
MSRVLTIGMLMILAAVAGFYARDYRRYNEMDERHFAFPHRIEDTIKPPKPNQELAIAYSSASENVFGDHNSWAYLWNGKEPPRDAEVYSGPASDNFALRMSANGKGIFILSDEDVRLGVSDPGDPIPIVSNYGQYLRASDTRDTTRIKTLVMDTKTLRAIWSFTGLSASGIEGNSIVLQCRTI